MELFEFEEKLKGHAEKAKSIISAPFDLKIEINKVEDNNMNKTEKISWFKRTGAIAAMATLCLVTVVSATPIKGFFKDIVRWDGAVVGSEYDNTTNEISIVASKTVVKDENLVLPIEINFENKMENPFASIEEIYINEYKITDKDGNVVLNLNKKVTGKVENGKVLIDLPIEENDNFKFGETYYLELDNLSGVKKADQDLKINGNWNITFVK